MWRSIVNHFLTDKQCVAFARRPRRARVQPPSSKMLLSGLLRLLGLILLSLLSMRSEAWNSIATNFFLPFSVFPLRPKSATTPPFLSYCFDWCMLCSQNPNNIYYLGPNADEELVQVRVQQTRGMSNCHCSSFRFSTLLKNQ